MGSYLIMLFVSLEQEKSLKELFVEKGWPFQKPDLSTLTEALGPLQCPAACYQEHTATSEISRHSLKSTCEEKCSRETTQKTIKICIKREPSFGAQKNVQQLPAKVNQSLSSTVDFGKGDNCIEVTAQKGKDDTVTYPCASPENTVLPLRTYEISTNTEYDSENDGSHLEEEMSESQIDEHDEELEKTEERDTMAGEVGDAEKMEELFILGGRNRDQMVESTLVSVAKSLVFHCENCTDVFDSVSDLKCHEEQAHRMVFAKTAGHVCSLCRNSFFAERHLKQHLEQGHQNEVLSQAVNMSECVECKKSFYSKQSYLAHMQHVHTRRSQTRHQKRNHVCQYCQQSFKRKPHLEDHIAQKHDPSLLKFACKLCDAKFSRPHALEYHENKVHFYKKDYMCSLCGKGCFSKVALKKHGSICSKSLDEQYTCQVCHQLFKTKHNLRLHMEAIHSDSPLTCDCGKVVKWRSSLAKHRRKCPLTVQRSTTLLTQPLSYVNQMLMQVSSTLPDKSSLPVLQNTSQETVRTLSGTALPVDVFCMTSHSSQAPNGVTQNTVQIRRPTDNTECDMIQSANAHIDAMDSRGYPAPPQSDGASLSVGGSLGDGLENEQVGFMGTEDGSASYFVVLQNPTHT